MTAIGLVGVVGLGNMGLPMAATLVRRGFTVAGFDVSADRLGLAAGQGVAPRPEVASLLGEAELLVLSLPRASVVEAVLTLPGALLARRDRRVVVLDTSTCDPGSTRRLAGVLGEAGHGLVDAPVSGGPAGAAEGKLAMMLGGLAEDIAAGRPVIDALAVKSVHVGPSGAGNVAKLVNNMLVAAHMITTAEALRLSEAAGVPAAAVLEVVNAATGRSAVSEVHYPRWVLPGGFDSGFSAGLMRKDVGLALEMARELGLDLGLCGTAEAMWREAALADGDDFTRIGQGVGTDG